MKTESLYDDGQGNRWDIAELLASNHSRSVRVVGVQDQLGPLLDTEKWGEDGGTIRQAIQLAQNDAELSQLPTEQKEHVKYIRKLSEKLRMGFEPCPIVIGLDGTLWDGLHRIAAYAIVGRSSCPAIDFSHGLMKPLLPTSESLRPLHSVLSPEWMTVETLWLQQGRFWGAEGFPHATFDKWLKGDFAERCFQELEIHRGWFRAETDLYLQDEFILQTGDPRLGPAIKELTAALCSDSMLAWVANATGHVALHSVEVIAHKMRPGDYIGYHNDYRPNGERVRGVIFLGTQHREIDDGVLVAMGSKENEVVEAIIPTHNRLFFFRVSANSNHLVTEVLGPDRFSINFSWCEDTEESNKAPKPRSQVC